MWTLTEGLDFYAFVYCAAGTAHDYADRITVQICTDFPIQVDSESVWQTKEIKFKFPKFLSF